jgi:hypothetical protein
VSGAGLWRTSASIVFAIATACDGTDRVNGDRPASRTQPVDSLAVSTSTGVEIWYRLSRTGTAADGSTCVERGLELRRAGKRIQVPLLYTGDTPTLLDDSTMRAVLWTNCRPVAVYRVDLRNGRPVPEPVQGGS